MAAFFVAGVSKRGKPWAIPGRSHSERAISSLKKEGRRDLIGVIDNRQVLQESKAVIEVNFVEPGEDNSSL